MTTDEKMAAYLKQFSEISNSILAIPSNSGTKMNVLTRLNEAFFWIGNLLKEQDELAAREALAAQQPPEGGDAA